VAGVTAIHLGYEDILLFIGRRRCHESVTVPAGLVEDAVTTTQKAEELFRNRVFRLLKDSGLLSEERI
jgi:hypothetical protein